MVRLSYFLCGVNDAGTTFVIRRVDAPRATRFLPIWCPEWFLSEWEREGPNAGSTYIGEVLMRMLAVEHKATFKALELTPPQPRFEPEHNKVEALSPFDHKGAMRPQRIAGDGPQRHDLARGALRRRQDGRTPEGWRVLGDIVLGSLAALRPDAFAPYPNLVPTVGE
jgi:hypothetical protein